MHKDREATTKEPDVSYLVLYIFECDDGAEAIGVIEALATFLLLLSEVGDFQQGTSRSNLTRVTFAGSCVHAEKAMPLSPLP